MKQRQMDILKNNIESTRNTMKNTKARKTHKQDNELRNFAIGSVAAMFAWFVLTSLFGLGAILVILYAIKVMFF